MVSAITKAEHAGSKATSVTSAAVAAAAAAAAVAAAAAAAAVAAAATALTTVTAAAIAAATTTAAVAAATAAAAAIAAAATACKARLSYTSKQIHRTKHNLGPDKHFVRQRLSCSLAHLTRGFLGGKCDANVAAIDVDSVGSVHGSLGEGRGGREWSAWRLRAPRASQDVTHFQCAKGTWALPASSNVTKPNPRFLPGFSLSEGTKASAIRPYLRRRVRRRNC
jgi:hypothetical protein